MNRTLGINEALILTALETQPDSSIADVARTLERARIGRDLDDGTIYMALRRMLERDLVIQERRTVVSADNRPREIGFYSATTAGQEAAARFSNDVNALRRLTELKA